MRLTPKSTQNLIRHAFRESRGFLALLLVGAPALYSVEAYFTTLTEALKAPGEINWFASTVFSLVFLTLNVRFINGNYDHIRSPQWADRNLGKTGFAFFIDVSAIILMHALLVVMATRTFLTAQGLPVGVTVSTTQDFYCPGFFSCVVLLLIVDVLWLSYKLMIEHVSRWLLNSGSGGVIKRIARGPLHFLSGAYAERNFMWWWINAVSLVSICVLWTLPRNIAGMNPNDSHVLQPWQQLISDQVHVSASNAGSGYRHQFHKCWPKGSQTIGANSNIAEVI